MYKHSQQIALIAIIGALIFTFAAFSGLHFWYAGFVFFFWLSLSALNYRHKTSLWVLKNNTRRFIYLYSFLFILGFIGDFVIGIHIANLWIYPQYDVIWKWILLYTIVYPCGGLSLVETIFFLANIFKEKFVFTHGKEGIDAVLNISDHLLDGLITILVVAKLLSSLIGLRFVFEHIILFGFLLWMILATIRFMYHIKHAWHWFAIILGTVFMSIFLHEIPNLAVLEWKYFHGPFLNTPLIFGIQPWVFVGWYFMTLLMLRVWVRLVWASRHRI